MPLEDFNQHYKISVIGAGAWGCALASLLADNGHDVIIYGRSPLVIQEINTLHTNHKYLNTSKLNDKVKGVNNLEVIKDYNDIVILATPSYSIKEMVEKIKCYLGFDTIIVNVCKGFDKESLKTFSQVIKSLLPYNLKNNIASLLGPTFAEEVIEKQFSAISVTSTNYLVAKICQKVFSNHYFRVYVNTDVIGCEYCAALKNVLAIACGIITGLGCKVNTKAALITRGMNEIKRFVLHFGGNENTCLSLAGIGDLILTCSSSTSRNYRAGEMIGKYGYQYFKEHNTHTIEGIFACEVAYFMANKYHIYAPVVTAVYQVLFEDAVVIDVVNGLVQHELKDEDD